MKAKLTDAQKIERIAQRHEDEGWTFYARYSGRCMFGDVCPGIVCPPYDTPKVVTAVKRAGIKAYPSHDSMGRDNIVYWSGIKSDPDPDEVERIARIEREDKLACNQIFG